MHIGAANHIVRWLFWIPHACYVQDVFDCNFYELHLVHFPNLIPNPFNSRRCVALAQRHFFVMLKHTSNGLLLWSRFHIHSCKIWIK